MDSNEEKEMKKCNFKCDNICKLQSMDTRSGFLTAISNYHECCGQDDCILYQIYKHLLSVLGVHKETEHKLHQSLDLEDRQHD